MARSSKPSIAGLAKALSLSVGTVSEALNNNPRVNIRTRQRVAEAAMKAGYIPNRQAAALRKQKSNIIGMLIPTLANPIYIERVASAQHVAYQHGYEVSFACSEWRVDQEAMLFEHFLSLSVDALIIDGALSKSLVAGEDELFKPFFDRDIPILQFAGYRGQSVPSKLSRLSIDTASGICEATQHLISLQHQHIGFVGIQSDPKGPHSSQRRGIQRALENAKHNIQTEFIGPTVSSIDMAYEAVCDRLKQSAPFPTALQVVGDHVVLGVLRALEDHGLRVPTDVSVVGFDNLAAAAFYKPRLTTVSQTHLNLGRKAVETAIDRIENHTPPKEEKIDLKLVVRESTAMPPRDRQRRVSESLTNDAVEKTPLTDQVTPSMEGVK